MSQTSVPTSAPIIVDATPRPCPKCGGLMGTPLYCPGGARCGSARCTSFVGVGEHLVRYCNTSKFPKLEPCLDANQA